MLKNLEKIISDAYQVTENVLTSCDSDSTYLVKDITDAFLDLVAFYANSGIITEREVEEVKQKFFSLFESHEVTL